MNAEAKKERGEPTGPLPIPSMAPKRRYDATPSAVIPRPLAPHTEVGLHPESRLEARTNKPVVLPAPNTSSLHSRAASTDIKDRKYQPLAAVGAMPVHEDRAARTTSSLQQQRLGPRIGYFTEEKRDTPAAMYIPPSQPPPARQSSAADIVHGSLLLPVQAPPAVASEQQTYRPRSISTTSHLSGKVSGWPILPPLEPENPPVRRDSFPPVVRQSYSPMVRDGTFSQQSILSSPAQGPIRPPSTTPLMPEPPRHVPAKRSNIMNILNDEPEEEAPARKRHASSEQQVQSSSRPAYEDVYSSRYSQASPYLTQSSRPYSSEYGGYPSVRNSTAVHANSDWMARFDPRGQQQQQQQQQHALPSLSGRATYNQLQKESSLTSLPPPTAPTPTPPPSSSYHSVLPQGPSAATPASPLTSQSYRESPPRESLAYPRRTSPGPGLMNLVSRPSASYRSLSLTGQYSTSPPPPPGQLPSLAPSSLTRSYTPPSILHHKPGSTSSVLPPVHPLPPRYGTNVDSNRVFGGQGSSSQLPPLTGPR